MELTPELQIQAVLKALKDTVVPAVDANNAMAQEQAQLCMTMLGFTLQRLPLAHRYAWTDLEHFVAVARDLVTQDGLPESEVKALAQSADQGTELLPRAQAGRGEIERAANAIRTQIGELVEALDTNSDVGNSVARKLVAHAKSQVERERAWLAPLGIESDPDVPEIEKLLHTTDTAVE